MKIYRGGIEIELTENELYEAYREAQKRYDLDDVRENFSYAEMTEQYDVGNVTVEEWEAAIPEVAEVYRNYSDDADEWYYRLRNAAEYVLKGMKED